MIENLISYICFSLITLFTLYWGLTFIAQVKADMFPKFNFIQKVLNPVQKDNMRKKIVADRENLLNNG